MTLTHIAILLSTGLISGLMNSVAGGGSFVAFPVLMMLGLSPIQANATATFAAFPGTVATLFTYRKSLFRHKEKLPFYITLSIIGGAVGALILLNISNSTFSNIAPYLLLTATMLFTFRVGFIRIIRRFMRQSDDGKDSFFYRCLMVALFIMISIYGGFFGAGMGIMLLALFSLMGMQHIHEMNSLRACTGLCANVIAIILFGISGIIIWQDAVFMSLGSIIGGYVGAYYAMRLPQSWSRNAVVTIGWGMTIYFFWKTII